MDPIPLQTRAFKEYWLFSHIRRVEIPDLTPSSWLLPYNKNKILEHGHSLNSEIPVRIAEAEFP
jgi:hypothetical protein